MYSSSCPTRKLLQGTVFLVDPCLSLVLRCIALSGGGVKKCIEVVALLGEAVALLKAKKIREGIPVTTTCQDDGHSSTSQSLHPQ